MTRVRGSRALRAPVFGKARTGKQTADAVGQEAVARCVCQCLAEHAQASIWEHSGLDRVVTMTRVRGGRALRAPVFGKARTGKPLGASYAFPAGQHKRSAHALNLARDIAISCLPLLGFAVNHKVVSFQGNFFQPYFGINFEFIITQLGQFAVGEFEPCSFLYHVIGLDLTELHNA